LNGAPDAEAAKLGDDGWVGPTASAITLADWLRRHISAVRALAPFNIIGAPPSSERRGGFAWSEDF
jgi:hypothetical protein